VSAEHAACFPRTGPIVVTSLQVWCRNDNAGVKGLIFSRQFRLGWLVDEIWANSVVENFVSFGFNPLALFHLAD